MEKEILTLENFNEKAFELLKKENWGSETISVDWASDACLKKEDMEEILRIKEQYKYDDWKDVIPMYVDDNWNIYDSVIREQQDYLIDQVLSKYVDYPVESIEYEEILTKLNEVVLDNFVNDYNVDELIKNTKADELDVFLISNNKNTLEDEIENIAMFEEYENLEINLDSEDFNAIAFLVQSQGYELEDLYNKEKVENSKFLKSLQSEIQENYEGGTIVFSKIGADLEEVLSLQNSKENIIIPKDGLCIGIHNVVYGSSSMLDIKLEKDIILNRENAKVMSDFGESEGYLVQEVNGMVDTKDGVNFKTTTEKGFEQHEIDVDKVLENAKEYFEIEMKDDEMEYE